MRVYPIRRFLCFGACLPFLLLTACDGGYDTNHDGIADDLGTAVDFDRNGDWDEFDIDRDGVLDGVGVDTNGDGVPDAIAVDVDKDRFFEAIDLGTGELVRSQLVPLPAPVYAIGQDPKQP